MFSLEILARPVSGPVATCRTLDSLGPRSHTEQPHSRVVFPQPLLAYRAGGQEENQKLQHSTPGTKILYSMQSARKPVNDET